MIAMLTILMLPMVYLTLKVKILVWRRDKVIPLMMVCLTSSILFWIFYFVFVLYSEFYIPWQYTGS